MSLPIIRPIFRKNQTVYIKGVAPSCEQTVDPIQDLIDKSYILCCNFGVQSSLNIVSSEPSEQIVVPAIKGPLHARIQMKLDSLDNWISSTLPIREGELAISYRLSGDVKYDYQMKIGQAGLSGQPKVWSSLPFITEDVSSVVYLDGRKTDLSIFHVSENEYLDLVYYGDAISDALYIVSSENANFFDERLVNVGYPLLSSDAATKGYVDDRIGAIDHSNFYTKSETNSLSSQFRDGLAYVSSLTAYQPSGNYLTGHQSLSDYYTKGQTDELSDVFRRGLATVQSLSGYQVSGNYLTSHQSLSDYYSKEQTRNLSSQFIQGLVYTSSLTAYQMSGNYSDVVINGKHSDLSILQLSEDDYHNLTDEQRSISNILYIVSSENSNFYGERLINVGSPEQSSDAATKGYVDAKIGDVDFSNFYTKKQTRNLSTDFRSGLATVSSLTAYQPSGNYLTEHQSLSDYYTKDQVDQKVQNVDLEEYYKKQEILDLSSQFRQNLVEMTVFSQISSSLKQYTDTQNAQNASKCIMRVWTETED